MSGHRTTQRSQAPDEFGTGAMVAEAQQASFSEALRDEIRLRPVVFLPELAELLGTSTRTIERQLRAGTFFIQTTPKVDQRHRWSRARVYVAIAEETVSSHRQRLLGPRAVAPRKSSGEAAREGRPR